jgi:hypothetical protein
LFVELVISHVLNRGSGAPPPHEVARLAETIERLRPIARTVIDAEFGRAMDRRSRVMYAEFIRLLAARDRHAGARASDASDASDASGASGASGSSGGEATAE